jgi:hypothetical protein
MARTHGSCRRGTRLRMSVPHGRWKTTTFVAGLTRQGIRTYAELTDAVSERL